MSLSKKKIKINNLAALLYITTIDTTQLNYLLEKTNDIKAVDRSIILNELILLRLIIVCFLLCSNKIFKSHEDRTTRLHLEYLEHFESDDYKFDGKVQFVDLFESRMKVYRPLLEIDCIQCAVEIAQIVADNCGVKNSNAFVHMIKIYYLNNLLNFNELLRNYKLI